MASVEGKGSPVTLTFPASLSFTSLTQKCQVALPTPRRKACAVEKHRFQRHTEGRHRFVSPRTVTPTPSNAASFNIPTLRMRTGSKGKNGWHSESHSPCCCLPRYFCLLWDTVFFAAIFSLSLSLCFLPCVCLFSFHASLWMFLRLRSYMLCHPPPFPFFPPLPFRLFFLVFFDRATL